MFMPPFGHHPNPFQTPKNNSSSSPVLGPEAPMKQTLHISILSRPAQPSPAQAGDGRNTGNDHQNQSYPVLKYFTGKYLK